MGSDKTDKEMRRIQYRAIDRADGGWVYGIPHRTDLDNWIMREEGGGVYCIDHETIGECLGLRDKHGKDLHEGDLVRLDYSSRIYEIIYQPEYARFAMKAEGDDFAYWMDPTHERELQIIGNIHEKKATEVLAMSV